MKKRLICALSIAATVAANAAVIPLTTGNRQASADALDLSGLANGESVYISVTATNLAGASFGGVIARGTGSITEEFFFGRLFNDDLGVGQNDGGGITLDDSGIAAIAGDVNMVLKITAGSAGDGSDDTFTYWIDPNFSLTEAANTATGSGTLTNGNIRNIDEVDYIASNNNPSWSGSAFTEGSTPFVVPEPSSTALIGLGGLALILRRRK